MPRGTSTSRPTLSPPTSRTESRSRPSKVQVFRGEAGADQLDLKGERHGGWVRFRRELQQVFADETEIFRRAEEVLRSGGVVVAAFTGGDAARKARAAGVLKSHGGQE